MSNKSLPRVQAASRRWRESWSLQTLKGETAKPQRSSEQAELEAEKQKNVMTAHWLSPRFVKGGCVKAAGPTCFAECLPPSQRPHPAHASGSGHGSAHRLSARFGKDACMCTERELRCAPADLKTLLRACCNGKDLAALLTR